MYKLNNPTPFYDYSRKFVWAFLNKLQIYFYIKNIFTKRWTGILQTFLQGLVWIELKNTTAPGGALRIAVMQNLTVTLGRANGATPIEILTGHAQEYELNTA